MRQKWTLRLITALLWALAAASVVFWSLRLVGSPASAAVRETAPVALSDNAARQTAIARLLGAQAGPSPSSAPLISRFTLAGVVSQGRSGAALLAVDGKPARPYRVGSAIDNNTVLQSVGPRHAVIAASMDGPALQRLELPAPLPLSAPSAITPAFGGLVTPAPAGLVTPVPAPAPAS